MIYQNPTLKQFLILQYIIQMARLASQAQVMKGSSDDIAEDCKKPTEEKFLKNTEGGWITNEKSDFRQRDEMDDVTREKRAGKDLRENGKKRRIMLNHNRIKVVNKMRQPKHGENLYNAAEMNFTNQDKEGYVQKGAYPLVNNNNTKLNDKTSTSDAMRSVLKVFGYNTRPFKSRKHYNIANTKLDRSRGNNGKKLKELYTNNATFNETRDIKSENVETSTHDGSRETHKKLKGHKFSSNHDESNNDSVMQTKKRKKNKDEKPARDKSENEYQNNKYTEMQLANLPNSDRKILVLNSDEMRSGKDELNIGGNQFTNLSIINKSFLDAFEKKIYGVQNNVHSKYNSKQYSDLKTIKPVSKAHINKYGKWIFSEDEEVDKNRHNMDKFDHFENYAMPNLNNDFTREELERINNRKLSRLHVTPPNINVNAINADEKYQRYHPAMVKQPIEESRNIQNNDYHTTKLKRRRQARKKYKNNGLVEAKINDGSVISEEELKDPTSSDNIEFLGTYLETNEGEGKRSERDTSKNNHKINDVELTENKGFDAFREENDDQVFGDIIESQDDFMRDTDANEVSYRKPPKLERNNNKKIQNVSNLRNNKIRLNKDEQIDSEDESNNVFERKDYESKYNEDEGSTADSCVAYKADQSTTEKTSSIKENGNAQKISVKVRTTPKNNKKSKLKSQNNNVEVLNATVGGGTSNYEQFLCGKLVDSFIESVLKKVQRSRKISKELGFGNDTEDSCDRCVELKLNKIPDLETMKNPLGKCSNGSATRCYRVPNSMGSFLKSLIYFEKENENNVYNKILDDSSFIFTGDYGEFWSRNEGGIGDSNNNKYYAGREGLNKELLEKQNVKEENNDDKDDDKTSNLIKEKDNKQFINLDDKSENEIEASAESIQKENGGEGLESEIKSSSTKKEPEGKKEKGSFAARAPTELDENIKGNEVDDVFADQDVIPSNKMQYSAYKDLDNDFAGPLSENPTKRRRKNYDIDYVSNSKTDISKIPDNKDGGKVGNDPYGHYHYIKAYPELSKVNLKHSYSSVDFGQNDRSKQGFGDPFQAGVNNLQNDYTNSKLLPQPAASYKGNKYSSRRNYYSYFPDTYIKNENKQKQPDTDTLSSGPDSYINKNWENFQYPIYPNQKLNVDAEDRRIQMSKNLKNDYDNSLKMVKRDAEPYEDELLFFEIPNMEYDLY